MIGKIKSLSFCLLFFISASFAANWNGSTREPENTKRIAGEIFYVITSAEELAWFAAQVNSGKSKINAVLANDIMFMDDTSKTSSANWLPIGKDSTMMFDGDFDGAGKTIYGLHCNRPLSGMFGVTDKYAVIKNVKLAKSSIEGSSRRAEGGYWAAFIGGIVAINKGALYGCTNSGSVTYTNIAVDSVFLGGIVGENRGSVDNCTNSGTITGTDYVGGIVGRNVGNSAVVKSCVNEGTVTSTGDYVGGIVGLNVGDTVVVKSCVNEGTVTSAGDYVGGIVGYVNFGRTIIEDCTNSGMITGEHVVGGIVGFNNIGDVKSCMNEGSVTGNRYEVGGIVGYVNFGRTIIEDCTNSGTITGSSRVGGIVGNSRGNVKSCMNEGSVIGTDTLSYYGDVGGIVGDNLGKIVGCLNSGFVSSTSGKIYSGGIAGYNTDTISVCTNYGLVEGNKSAGIAGYNGDEGMVTDCRSLVLTSKRMMDVVRDKSKFGGSIRNSFSVVADESYNTGLWYAGGEKAEMCKSDMQSDRFAWILNTTNGDSAHSGIWSRDSVDYPVFADSLHRPIYKVIFDNGRDSMDCFTNYKGLVPFPGDPEQPGKLFRGWFTEDGDKIDNLTVFSKDQTVYAAYTDLYFSIRFFDSDSSLLDSQYVKYGDMPSDVPIPTKDSTAQYIYNFKGWYVYPVTRDFDYYAAYSEIVRYYMIRFLNDDGVALQSLNAAYGTLPVYSGPIPKKTSSGKYEYVFSGWSPTLKAVIGEATYMAVFDSTRIIPQAISVTVAAPAWSITAAGRNFQIHAAPVGKSYALFDLQGKVLAKGRIESSEMALSVPRAGSYIVRVGERSVRVNAR